MNELKERVAELEKQMQIVNDMGGRIAMSIGDTAKKISELNAMIEAKERKKDRVIAFSLAIVLTVVAIFVIAAIRS